MSFFSREIVASGWSLVSGNFRIFFLKKKKYRLSINWEGGNWSTILWLLVEFSLNLVKKKDKQNFFSSRDWKSLRIFFTEKETETSVKYNTLNKKKITLW